MRQRGNAENFAILLGAFAIALPMVLAAVPAHAGVLRVCADPNNLPFSNSRGEGFENKIATLAARDFGYGLEYAFALQNARFIKHTLGAGKCDVIIGVPADLDEVATTEAYYASTYVFLSRKADNLRIERFTDPRLKTLTIGVHLIGDESTPPTLALAREGIVDNVRGYMIDGDFSKPDPPARLIEAVADRDIDVAAVWGPFGGYFSAKSRIPLLMTPVHGAAAFAPLRFSFPIAMGVRKTDAVLRARLNNFITKERTAIRKILVDYRVPLVDMPGGVHG
ncbi:MAG TPA: quinoprotein dehydrogenase-associated putative ABC transporter substrate-binding protein [Rhizomicrobium sp.]|nr:quinoprotein dehydrogenase-associated putative ABC transporter substrate-binding protein [Rhizomicrobium sp.]